MHLDMSVSDNEKTPENISDYNKYNIEVDTMDQADTLVISVQLIDWYYFLQHRRYHLFGYVHNLF